MNQTMNQSEAKTARYISHEESSQWKMACEREEKAVQECLRLIGEVRDARDDDDREDVLEYFGDIVSEWVQEKSDSEATVDKLNELLMDMATYFKYGISPLFDEGDEYLP